MMTRDSCQVRIFVLVPLLCPIREISDVPDGRLIVTTLSESVQLLLLQIAQVLPSIGGGHIWTVEDQMVVDQLQNLCF